MGTVTQDQPPLGFDNGKRRGLNHVDTFVVDSKNVSDNEEKKKRRGGVRHILTKYADRCSLNGIVFIRNSHSPAIKLMWSTLLAVAIVLSLLHLFLLISTFLEFRKQTDVELTFSTLQFPAVTFCNTNPMKMSLLKKVTANLSDHISKMDPENLSRFVDNWLPMYSPQGGNANFSYINGTDGNFTDFGTPTVNPEDQSEGDFLDKIVFNMPELASMEDLKLEDADYEDSWKAEAPVSKYSEIEQIFRRLYAAEPPELRAKLGHQIQDMLVKCTFAGRKCVMRNFTLVQSNSFGNCYTIEYRKFLSRRSGPADGLELILYLDTTEYVPGLSSGRGLQVVIHEQGTLPFPDDEGFAVASGTLTSVGIRQIEVSRLGIPYGKCTSADIIQKKYGVKYTRMTCQKVCEQIEARQLCGCYDELTQDVNQILHNHKNLPPCKTTEQIKCLLKAHWKFGEGKVRCECENPCKEKKYVKTVSIRQWPSTPFANLIMKTMCMERPGPRCEAMKNIAPQDLPREFIRLNVYFEDLNFEKLTEHESYETSQFISDIGGTVGLWLGLSILGMFELVHLVSELVVYACRRWGTGRQSRG